MATLWTPATCQAMVGSLRGAGWGPEGLRSCCAMLVRQRGMVVRAGVHPQWGEGWACLPATLLLAWGRDASPF